MGRWAEAKRKEAEWEGNEEGGVGWNIGGTQEIN